MENKLREMFEKVAINNAKILRERANKMKEIETLYVSRNDYKSVWSCENCGHTYKGWGYSDRNFDDNVIPNAICPKCGKSAQGETAEEQMNRLGITYRIPESN